MKILVPVEDPLFGAAIVDLIARHNWPPRSQFIVVHVIEPNLLNSPAHTVFFKQLEVNEEQVVRDAATLVNSVAQAINISHPDAIVSQEVVQAHVKAQIIRMAEKWDADLIIAGTHGRSGFSRFVLGSVSLSLTSELKAPLILVRYDAQPLETWETLDYLSMVQQAFEHNKKKQPSERSIRKVLVALDETALSNQVIAFITKHNWDPECEFKLLSVVEKPAAFLLSESAAKQLSDRLADETEKRLQEFSSTLIAEMKNSRIETTVTKGQAKKVILSTAKDWNADLLIVGCHFQNSISRFLLGSVSLPTLCEAPCSVLLIKESQLAKPAIDEKELIVHRSESVVPVTK